MALLFYLGGSAVEEHTHTSEKGERERAIAIAIGLRSRRDAAVDETTINLVYFSLSTSAAAVVEMPE